MGFRLNRFIAWFLTFNFVNIAWVFFRAKEWDDAIKVLKGMFGGNIMLPANLENKLFFLKEYGVEYGSWLSSIYGTKWTIVSLFIGFILVLTFQNSIQKLSLIKLNYKTILFSSILFTVSLMSAYRVSEFLYFNF